MLKKEKQLLTISVLRMSWMSRKLHLHILILKE